MVCFQLFDSLIKQFFSASPCVLEKRPESFPDNVYLHLFDVRTH